MKKYLLRITFLFVFFFFLVFFLNSRKVFAWYDCGSSGGCTSSNQCDEDQECTRACSGLMCCCTKGNPQPAPTSSPPTPTSSPPTPTSSPPQDCPSDCSCVPADQCGGGKRIVPEYKCPNPYVCCCGTGCFLAGTEISTIDGSKKKIEDIGAKEIIQSLELVSGWFSTSKVGEPKKTEREGYYLLKFIDSQFTETELKVTGEHPIFTLKDKKKPLLSSLMSGISFTFLQGDFVKVEDLMIGDYVRTKHGWTKLIEKTYIPEKVLVYNLFATSPYSNYFANDILVHNKGPTGVGSINGRICTPSDPANPDADAACVVDGSVLDLYPGACNRTVVSNTKLCDDGPHETIIDGITFDYWGVSTGDDPATKDIAEEDNRDVSYTNLMFNNDCFNCGACGQCGELYFGPSKRGKYVIRINTPPGWVPVKCKTWYKDLFTFSGINQCDFYVNYGGDDSGSYFAIKKATPPICEFINPPSQVEVGKSYTIKVKATSQEPTLNIRKVTISRAQTNDFNATTGWREIKNITCNGQTCEGEGVWNVTSDDLTREGNKWWLACNAFYYSEDESGTNSTRCTGNPWSIPGDWADCWPPPPADQPGIDADAYSDKDSQEVTICQNIAPGAPTNPSPANDVDLNTLPSSLSWRAPDSWGVCCPGHNNHYLVYLNDNSDFSSPIINGESTTATSYSLAGKVEAGKTYHWKVVAHNDCLTTPTPHTVWSFCINKAPNAATTLSDGIFRDNQNILLSWKNISNWGLNCAGNNNQYLVYYCKAGPSCTSTSVPEINRCLPIANNSPTTGFSSCILAGPLDWESTYYWKVVTSNGALTNEAFGSFKITYPSAWWQTKTGDVYGSEIFSPIWRDVPDNQRYFSLVGPFGPQSGLVAAPNCLGSSGARCNFGAAQATQTNFPTSGRGGINANFTPLLNDYSYDQLAHLVDLAIKENKQESYNSGVRVIKSGTINKTALVGASAGLYYYPPYGTGDVAVSLNDNNFSVGANEKLIVFVEDDLNINSNITVTPGGFLAFIVSGNIEIAANVTQVQGVYFADGNLTVETVGDTSEQQFNGQGIFVAKAGVVLERSFRSVANTTTPTEVFTFDPAYLFTAPKVFREKPYLWQEVIP